MYISQQLPKNLPQWLKYDKDVLKFVGYFTEAVNESAYENYRIRKVDIFYYLSDDTIQINEQKYENSQIVQGYFIIRQRCYKNDEKTPITWRDLNLQTEITLFGKTFRICNCDDFTKFFYNQQGIKLNDPEKIPEINYEDKYKNVDFAKAKRDIADIKEYIEVSLNGGHPNRGLKQFLENDRKVLSFELSWFDNQYDKEEKRYKLNYYLADNSLEICETKENNSGKDPFPYLLRKMKLPKKAYLTYYPGMEHKDEDYYMPEDLILGKWINVYNRKCQVVDCDAYTKQWYKDNFGIDMQPIKVKRNPPQRVIHPIPDYNGFGSEEDSLMNVFYLDPSGKIHEYYSDRFKRDKHILRFRAKLVSSTPSDEERNFVISFWVGDGSIQVFEDAERNSGRIKGKFLERAKMKNPYTNSYYTEKDFKIGNTIYLNKNTFKLLECDDYTKKYMQDNAEVFIEADPSEVIERIRTSANNFKNLEEFLISMLESVDPEGTGYVTSDSIRNGLAKFNVYLSDQELVTLIKRLKLKSENGYNLYSVEDLYNLVVCYK